MSDNLYKDTEWALTKEASELRDIMLLLGMDKDLVMATLERLLPENVVYDLGEEDG